MDFIKNKSDTELNKALLAELAKSRNEISTASNDIKKANSRISFALVIINELLDRKL